MKKLSLTLLFCFALFFSVFSQNGGIASENSVIKISFLSYNQLTGNFSFLVTNKQSCQVSAKYIILRTNELIDITLAANGTHIINVPGLPSQDVSVKARAMSFCPSSVPDQGWVEHGSQIGPVLPIVFEYIKVRKIDSKTVEVEFSASSTDGEDRFNIQVSTDARTFKTVAIVFPGPIVVNKVYKVKIKI
jgi:hypothetical protein